MNTSLTIRTVMAIVAIDYRVGLNALISGGQSRTLTEPRHVAMWLAYRNVEAGMPAIGHVFGDRDSTTVCNAVQVIDARLATDRAFAERLDRLTARIAAVEAAKLVELGAIEAALTADQSRSRASRSLLVPAAPAMSELVAAVEGYLTARRRQRADKYTRGELASRNLAEEAFAKLTSALAVVSAQGNGA